MEKVKRYRQFPIFRYPERTWMDKEVEKAPIWCSVDLRAKADSGGCNGAGSGTVQRRTD